jgi:hypothetical protein
MSEKVNASKFRRSCYCCLDALWKVSTFLPKHGEHPEVNNRTMQILRPLIFRQICAGKSRDSSGSRLFQTFLLVLLSVPIVQLPPGPSPSDGPVFFSGAELWVR